MNKRDLWKLSNRLAVRISDYCEATANVGMIMDLLQSDFTHEQLADLGLTWDIVHMEVVRVLAARASRKGDN